MKVRELLAQLNDLTVGSLELEVYIDVEGDEYKEMELVPIAEDEDGEVIGFVVCELKDVADDGEPKQLSLPFDKEEIH
jgi:hypothetical protein